MIYIITKSIQNVSRERLFAHIKCSIDGYVKRSSRICVSRVLNILDKCVCSNKYRWTLTAYLCKAFGDYLLKRETNIPPFSFPPRGHPVGSSNYVDMVSILRSITHPHKWRSRRRDQGIAWFNGIKRFSGMYQWVIGLVSEVWRSVNWKVMEFCWLIVLYFNWFCGCLICFRFKIRDQFGQFAMRRLSGKRIQLNTSLSQLFNRKVVIIRIIIYHHCQVLKWNRGSEQRSSGVLLCLKTIIF